MKCPSRCGIRNSLVLKAAKYAKQAIETRLRRNSRLGRNDRDPVCPIAHKRLYDAVSYATVR